MRTTIIGIRTTIIGIVVAAYCSNAAAETREWSDVSGKLSIKAELVECNVTLRLADGSTKTVELQSLSNADRLFVFETMRKGIRPRPADTAPNGNPPPSPDLPSLIENLKEALAEWDKQKVRAAIQSVRAIDPSFDSVRLLVEVLLAEDESAHQAIWILSEVGTDANWSAEGLLQLETRLSGRSSLLNDVKDCYDGISFERRRRLDDNIARVELRREVVRLLAQFRGIDDEVNKLFTSRLAWLQSAPEPEVRATAALGLSRAMAFSKEAIPALIHALKNDPAPHVRLAAATSLGGFGDSAKSALPTLVDSIESDTYESHYLYLAALTGIDHGSGPSRKTIGKYLEYYRRTGDDRGLQPACRTLGILGTDADWAISQLIDSAAVALKLGRSNELGEITIALEKVGPRDARVISFYEKASKGGPPDLRVFCDSVARQLKLELRQ